MINVDEFEPLFVSRMNLDDEAKVEEERRLFYVGITRARQVLECFFALQRMRFGSIVPMAQSRFVETIPPASTGLLTQA